MSTFESVAAELEAHGRKVGRGVEPIVRKGAVNIKKQLTSEMGQSRHFGQVARSISFDTQGSGIGFEAQIGAVTAGATVGDLAHLAYFGGSHGGGGTVPDPEGALNAEGPRFVKALEDLMGEL